MENPGVLMEAIAVPENRQERARRRVMVARRSMNTLIDDGFYICWQQWTAT
jgi:hypothetical protein